jgi:UDP-N-acetylglucosamine pyrophosphorylase
LLDINKGVLPLPLILNEKVVGDIPVVQFETAMGSAISLFENARAICVPRSRFLPVKKNNDLLLLWSDNFELNENFELKKRIGAKDTIVDLDNNCFKNIEDLVKACEKGVPSLFNCDSLKVRGNVQFGENEVFEGNVEINC